MIKLDPKLFNFASQIDDNTIEQAKQTASMSFVHPHVALMPDAHSRKGSAVGTVIPTRGAVIPAAVDRATDRGWDITKRGWISAAA